MKYYDLCIVGSGIAGALVAAEAARQGRTVAIIEAGSRFEFGKRLDLLRHHQTFGGMHYPWQHPGRDEYVDTSKAGIGSTYRLELNRVKAVGGSTLHWGGRIQRFMPSDFRTASTYGMGMDWPLSYDELEPFYCDAEWKIGVSGTPDAMSPPRSRDYPMPGFPLSVDEQFWVPHAQRLGIHLRTSAFAINSMPYAGRSECMAFAACNICPSGARYSADFHVKEAEATGRCKLFTETVARRIDCNAAGEVTAVHATTLDGKDLEFKAKRYVIAAHAVESARLLLLSKVGNHSDQVGRNFMEHAYTKTSAFFPQQRFYPARVGYEKLESLSFYDGPERRARGAIKLQFMFDQYPLEDMYRHNLWGAAVARRDKERFGHWMGVSGETEMQAKGDSRISLDSDKKDLFGDPVPHVHMVFDEVDRRTQKRSEAIGAELLSAIGAREIEQTSAPGYYFAAHHMGTCRMSDDADKGVVDKDLRVHGSPNLFLAGSSVFPTSGALQPTLTIAALSLRLAAHLAQLDA